MKFSSLIGIAGMSFIIYGAFLPIGLLQKILFFLGGIALLVTAIIEKQKYLIGLEIIVFIGTLLAFFDLSSAVKSSILFLSCVVIIPWLIKENELSTKSSLTGLFGLLALALGYAVSNPWIYFIGGILLCIHSAVLIKKDVKIAYLWGTLNGFFSVSAALSLVRIYF